MANTEKPMAKVGDRILIKSGFGLPSGWIGNEAEVLCVDKDGWAYILEGTNMGCICPCRKHSYVVCPSGYEVIKSKNYILLSGGDLSNSYLQVFGSRRYGIAFDEATTSNKPTKKTIMKRLSNFIKKSVNTDTQELLKAGLINGDLEPTEKGWDVMEEITWFKTYEEIVARAKEINTEAEAEAKK